METLDYFNVWNPQIITLLYNAKRHMEKYNSDFPIIISGKPGTGKSMFALHIFELWNKVMLGKNVEKEDIKYIKSTKLEWLQNFKELQQYDLSINDEAADGLSSKEALKSFGRNIEKLYNVNRKKKLFSILIIPNYFHLSSYFRDRVKGLFYFDKIGEYQFYSEYGLKFLNAYNENRRIKSMHLAYPLFKSRVCDYEGILRKPYDEYAQDSADQILNEIITSETQGQMNSSAREVKTKKIMELTKRGLTQEEIGEELGMTRQTVAKYYKQAINLL